MSGKAPWGALPNYLARGVGVGLAALVAQWVSLGLWDRIHDSPIIGLSGPMLLALLLCTDYRYWPAYNIGWLGGMLLMAMLMEFPGKGIFAVSLVMLGLITVAAWLLSRLRKDQPADNFFQLLVFLAVAVVALPLATGCLVSWLSHAVELPNWLSREWWHVALAGSLGYVLLTPAILSLVSSGSSTRRDAIPSWHVLLITGGALVILWLGWRELGSFPMTRPLMLLAPVPLAIFAAMRAQAVGTCVVNLAVGLIAIQLSLDHVGPFVQEDSGLTTISVQLWMLGVAVASLYLVALVEQRKATQRALVVSSTEVRELAGRLIVAQEQERAHCA